MDKPDDMVHQPPHYSSDVLGFECIDAARWMPFCTGNAFKYVFRAKSKGNTVQDLEKARVYLEWAIEYEDTPCIFARNRKLQELYMEHLQMSSTNTLQARILRHIIMGRFESAIHGVDRWINFIRNGV